MGTPILGCFVPTEVCGFLHDLLGACDPDVVGAPLLDVKGAAEVEQLEVTLDRLWEKLKEVEGTLDPPLLLCVPL